MKLSSRYPGHHDEGLQEMPIGDGAGSDCPICGAEIELHVGSPGTELEFAL